jgi:ActR/RegA family two-component response regulator
MNAKTRSTESNRKALLVHPDVAVLAKLQSTLNRDGVTAIIARDLPTMLLAITQHYFDMAIVASRISEEGDGWPVAGVLRMVFPKAFIVMLAPSTDVLTLKAAINNGVDEIFERNVDIDDVANRALQRAVAVRHIVQ